jgi:hypothetical protein
MNGLRSIQHGELCLALFVFSSFIQGPTLDMAHGQNAMITALNLTNQVLSPINDQKPLDINPLPILDSLTPSHVKSGGEDFLLQIRGQGFITNTVVSWNDLIRPTTYISTTLVQATIYSTDINMPGVGAVTAFNPPPEGGTSNALVFTIDPNNVYLPIIIYCPIPSIPILYNIDNTSQNNIYSVSWSKATFATAYILQEATDPSFNSAIEVYNGTGLSWITPFPGKAPGTYYYRVKSYNVCGLSDWSLPRTVTVYPPAIPSLYSINNSDQNNTYDVSWNSASFATGYRLQESTNPAFSNFTQVYNSTGFHWTTPSPGKIPGTYYYRVQSYNIFGSSGWSTTRSVTIYPLFVGLNLSWDGNGYIRGSEYADIGSHETRVLDALTEPDTIRSNSHQWYDPNPYGWEDEYWTSYYSVLTGLWKGSSTPGDPSWKWGYYWFLPYNLNLSNGMIVWIDNQDFSVSGPHTGITPWGHTIHYWQLVNRHKFLIWDDGGDWKQYVHVGEAILHYDAGSSRLLLYNNVKRHFYYEGDLTQDSVQYIDNLTAANSIPGSPELIDLHKLIPEQPTISSQTPKHPSKGMKIQRR